MSKTGNIFLDQSILYDVYADNSKDYQNIILTDDNRIACGFHNREEAVGYALGCFEWSDFESVFVIRHTTMYHNWSHDEAEELNEVVWSCTSFEIYEISETLDDDIICDETNELVDFFDE